MKLNALNLGNDVTTASDGVQTILIVKRLMSQYRVLRHKLFNERSRIKRLDVLPITKALSDRIGNFHPLRIFWPTASVLIRKGFINRSFLTQQVDNVNNKASFETDVLDQVRNSVTSTDPFSLKSEILYKALRLGLELAFKQQTRLLNPVLNLRDLLSYTNWQANSGYPECAKKNTLRKTYFPKLQAWLDGKLTLRDYLNYPCLVFNRIQAKDGVLKRRAVFGYPFIFSIIEQCYFHPIVESLVDNETFVVGKRQLEISSMMSELKDFEVYTFDYSKFDIRVKPIFIYLAFELFKCILRLDDRLTKELDYIRIFFCFSRFYHPYFGTIDRTQGVPSGSGGTNLIDSVVNLIATCYLIVYCNLTKHLKRVRIHGDDIVLAFDKPIDVSRFVASADKVGMVLKFKETDYHPSGTDRVHFLGSEWRDGQPYRDEVTMSLSAATVSGLLERADSKEDAVEGYIYSIFGYDCRFNYFWRKLGFRPTINRSIFVYPRGDPSLLQGLGKEANYQPGSSEPWKSR